MSDFLESMVRERRERVAQDAERGAPIATLRAEAEARRGDRRPFLDALRREPGGPVRVIAEVKRASPSAGMLREAYDPVSLASEYARCGAAAISVLTEPTKFLGSVDDLVRVRGAVALPVLLKDFVVHERQIYEAGARGADAALLIVAALDRRQVRDFAELMAELGITPLVEILEAKEIDAAVSLPGALGVNNRDLRTLAMRRGHAERILPLLPADRVRVAESGYQNDAAIRAATTAGADAVLVGETLLRGASVESAFRELFGARGAAGAAGPGPGSTPGTTTRRAT